MPRKASARLLYATISTSERIAELGVKGALLFTWLFAHCDDQGRYAGSAKRVKAEVVPMVDDITIDDVEEALKAMGEAGLIIRYGDDAGRELIQIVDWWDFQHGLRIRNPSRFPAPEGWQDKVTESLTRDNRGKFRRTEEAPGLEEQLVAVLRNGLEEIYCLDGLCDITRRPGEAVLEALTRLYHRKVVGTVEDMRGKRPEPPFDGDEGFYLVSRLKSKWGE